MTLQDTAVFDLIKEEEQRQLNGIELIASENFTSPASNGSHRFCTDQQICRGLSRQALLRRL